MFLRNIFGIGHLDLQFIEDHHSIVENSVNFDELNHLSLSEINANTFIYEIFSCINQKVFSAIHEKIKNDDFVLPQNFSNKKRQIKNKLLEYCDERMNEFSPFINCIDSWFQNEIDSVGARNKCIDEIVSDVFEVFVKNVIE